MFHDTPASHVIKGQVHSSVRGHRCLKARARFQARQHKLRVRNRLQHRASDHPEWVFLTQQLETGQRSDPAEETLGGRRPNHRIK